jgi:aldose 1-epimerase
MTGPANAFNSGDGLRWLAPGEELAMSWGISAALESGVSHPGATGES